MTTSIGLSSLWGSAAPASAAQRTGLALPRTPRRMPGRRAPAGSADLALRLLLRHNDWWAHLGNDDHELLHDLGGTHGAAVAWLEQSITEHGEQTWAALDQALDGVEWQADARRWVQGAGVDEEQSLPDLQRVLHRIWIARLREDLSEMIAQGANDRDKLDRVAALQKRVEFHLRAERELAGATRPE